MQGCGISRTEDGVDFSLFGTILCGPGASSEERKVKQLFEAIKAVELERAMLCLTKGTAVDARDKVRGHSPVLAGGFRSSSTPAGLYTRCCIPGGIYTSPTRGIGEQCPGSALSVKEWRGRASPDAGAAPLPHQCVPAHTQCAETRNGCSEPPGPFPICPDPSTFSAAQDGRSMLDLTNIQEEIHAVLSRFIDGATFGSSIEPAAARAPARRGVVAQSRCTCWPVCILTRGMPVRRHSVEPQLRG